MTKLDKQQKQEVKKEVEKKIHQVEEQIEKKTKKKIEQEVKKRLKEIIKEKTISSFQKTTSSAKRFKKELKKHTATAMTAAFAFLIALSWRTPIKNSVDKLIQNLGLGEKFILFEYISAITLTIIAVLALIIIAKWTSDPKKANKL